MLDNRKRARLGLLGCHIEFRNSIVAEIEFHNPSNPRGFAFILDVGIKFPSRVI